MPKQDKIPTFNERDITYIKQYIEDEDIGGIAYYVFEKFNEYFKYEENERDKVMNLFIENVKNNQYNTYLLLKKLSDADLAEELQELLNQYIAIHTAHIRIQSDKNQHTSGNNPDEQQSSQ